MINLDEDNDLSDEQVQRILSRVKPAMKKWLNTKELLPFLKRHHVLTDSEMQLLKSSTLMLREQVCRSSNGLYTTPMALKPQIVIVGVINFCKAKNFDQCFLRPIHI